MARLSAEEVLIAYEDRDIVHHVSLKIPDGKITAIIGPNGCGKSTLLKALSRIHEPKSGAVYLDGKMITKESTKKVAQKLAILPQTPAIPAGLTIAELVSYGRYPYQKAFGRLREKDLQMVEWALEATGIKALKHQSIESLSGGQRQRVWIAMALAQETDIILLDEPTTYLDLSHQLEILELLRRLNQEEQRTIAMVIHDLNHAARFADHLIAMKDGRIAEEGTPKEIISKNVLKEVFSIDAEIVTDPRTGKPVCLSYDLVKE